MFRFRYPEKRVSFKFGLKPVNRNFTFKPEKNFFLTEIFFLFLTPKLSFSFSFLSPFIVDDRESRSESRLRQLRRRE